MDGIERALMYAYRAHRGQVRKYTGEPYITHPISVCAIVESVEHDESMLMAALLHDVVEDTAITLDEIAANFGNDVACHVEDLTDVSTPSDGNRKIRKDMDRAHTSHASNDAKTIKLADLIHNSSSITQYDTDFAAIYMKEKKSLLEVLIGGNRELHSRACKIVEDYYFNRG
tara:strand:+ start:163 stop:678 length:516 start_codon:yes stop_codon:yes gene_type:complete